MPELPEVETVRRVIAPQIAGRTIEKITLHTPQVVAHPAAEDFCRRLRGQRFLDVGRRGKYLILRMEGGARIILHLRMTGWLYVAPAGYPRQKHTHVVLSLTGGSELRFEDVRRFGRFWLLGAQEEDTVSGTDKLGLEPTDPALSPEGLAAALGKNRRAIKTCLLDQRIVCGIGNIYADEILFAAGLHPQRPASSLRTAEWQALSRLIPQQIGYFTEKNAISAEDYLRGGGREYRNTPFLQVYGHAGEACPRCGRTLEKITVGGRGSVFCPACQKREETQHI